ncbi:MAG: fluoride efflux transporter CrcB [Emergencia sp.]|nr:fluoride efflux transporter CrcB [Emergencia sp.]
MFIQCIAVGVGGFIGSVFRYLISLIPTLHKGVIPWQTLLVNVVGAILIGMIVKYCSVHTEIDGNLILLLKVGVCGGFTTFSTFALESAGMLQGGNQAAAFFYTAASVTFCIGGVFLGQYLIR